MPELSKREQQIMAAFNSQGDNMLAGRMGIKIIEASPERIVGTMPVQGNTQPYGILHGGASCVLAESLGSLGAALQAGRTGSPSASRSTPRITGLRHPAWSPASRRWPTAAAPCRPSTS